MKFILVNSLFILLVFIYVFDPDWARTIQALPCESLSDLLELFKFDDLIKIVTYPQQQQKKVFDPDSWDFGYLLN